MNKLIQAALGRPRTVTVAMLAIVVLGILSTTLIPIDVLPVYNKPGVQVLTFYAGMPPEAMANAITNRLERWVGQASGMERQESRTIMGASIIHNLFAEGVDPNAALTQTNSLALAEVPNLPPGTLPPIVLPYDPTATVPVCIVAVDSKIQGQTTLYDVARYEVRNYIMSSPGADAPVVFGGKIRAVLAYIDPIKMEARGLSAMDVLKALENYNLFLPTGDAKIGIMDYAIDSNSMFDDPKSMVDIPLRVRPEGVDFLGDVAIPKDTALIQTNLVRINGRREVYIPVYRRHGSSTLRVVENLKNRLPSMAPRLTRPGIDLKIVMDQSVYVRQSIDSLITEGVLGALLCSLVILLFLGQPRMTFIAVLSIPLAIMAAIVGLYVCGQTINVMTLAGLALAIGPLVDSAIICLENTERHLGGGTDVREAAFNGASEVAMPELVASCCTLLVLAPLALMPGEGRFLYRPMAIAVAFAMACGYLLSRTYVPSRSAEWLQPHPGAAAMAAGGGPAPRRSRRHTRHTHDQPTADQFAADGDSSTSYSSTSYSASYSSTSSWQQIKAGTIRAFAKWQGLIAWAIHWYARRLQWALQHRLLVLALAVILLVGVVGGVGMLLRREFFPVVDAGSFDIFVNDRTGLRLEVTEKHIAEIENFIRGKIGGDLELVLSEIGVQSDWSAAYTENAAEMDTTIKVQLTPDREQTSQYYADLLRKGFQQDPRFNTLRFGFNTGGTIRSALNLGKVTPINIRVKSKHLKKAHKIAERIRTKVAAIDGVVDARVIQRMDYPEYFIEVDRSMARKLGLSQDQVMKNVVSALKSSIQFNKNNFWIDPVSQNQYFVGVQYPEREINSLDTILNVSITSPMQPFPIPVKNLVNIKPKTIAADVTHVDLQPSIDVSVNVHGRDLGHVADDVADALNEFGKPLGADEWAPYDPEKEGAQEVVPGGTVVLSGEYEHMEQTFANFALGICLSVVFIYFLMVVLLDSYLIPVVVLSAVPVSLVGVVLMLFITGTAINVQSLLGVVFTVGIVVSNTVLLTDFAENIRKDENLEPTEAILRAAQIRVRPVVMTALAALFALVPMALALERGSEANAPLGRAVIGGLLAGLLTTLVVVPALYALVVRGKASK